MQLLHGVCLVSVCRSAGRLGGALPGALAHIHEGSPSDKRSWNHSSTCVLLLRLLTPLERCVGTCE